MPGKGGTIPKPGSRPRSTQPDQIATNAGSARSNSGQDRTAPAAGLACDGRGAFGTDGRVPSVDVGTPSGRVTGTAYDHGSTGPTPGDTGTLEGSSSLALR